MNIDKIDVDSIRNIETAKEVIRQIIDEVFIMNKEIQRQLNTLSSQNVKTLDFNITKVENVEKILPKEG